MTPKHKYCDAVFYDKKSDIINHFENDEYKSLYILGRGFDPRMMVSFSLVSKKIKCCDIILVYFSGSNEFSSPRHEEWVTKNMEMFNEKTVDLKLFELKIPDDSNLPVFLRDELIPLVNGYERIIIDISSMPQSVYFNIINRLEKYIDSQKVQHKIKLDIITCENSTLDDLIIPTDYEKAVFLPGFKTFSNDLESDINRISVWFPLLGKNCYYELKPLHSLISPTEIFPVLPFPSKNPRRSEEILSELGGEFFNDLKIDKRNIIYTAERNVFDVYNKLHYTIQYYNEVLMNIGEPRFYVSTGSSKIIELGALLVYLDLSEEESGPNISFAHVKNNGYNLEQCEYNHEDNQICLLCLEDDRFDW